MMSIIFPSLATKWIRNSPRLIRSNVRFRYAMARKPLPKFVPATKQIDKVISESEKLLNNKNLKENVSDAKPEVDENCGSDFLPPGMNCEDLPPYKKVYGFDKKNPILRSLKNELLAKNVHGEEKSKVVVVESRHLIQDVMEAGFYPKTFVFSRLNLLHGFRFDKNRPLNLVQIPYKNIDAWSELKTSPGIMATFDLDEVTEVTATRVNKGALPMTVILDNVRSPDNIGALVRVGAAAGCSKIIAMKGCADVWSNKAVRASAGAHFFINIESRVAWSSLRDHIPNHAVVLLADAKFESGEQTARGDEQVAWGESDGEQTGCGESDGVEVADLAKLSRQMTSYDEDGNVLDLSYDDEELMAKFANMPLEGVPVTSLDLGSQAEVVVVFGGETNGLSNMAKKLAHCQAGCRVSIPMRNDNIDSLNVASAASVILFSLGSKLETNK